MTTNTYKIRVGRIVEYESNPQKYEILNNPFQSHNGRRFQYYKEIDYFEEREFKTREDLERWKKNIYGENSDFVFEVRRRNILGDWHNE